MAVGPAAGLVLGAVDSVVNHVPVVLGEVGTARAERGGWSQAAEFASLVLDAGWAWAATAVLAGWLVSRPDGIGRRERPAREIGPGNSPPAKTAVGTDPPAHSILRAAAAGGLALVFATSAYYGVDLLFDGGVWWGPTTRFWLIGGVLFGAPLGAAGVLIRRPGPVGVIAGLLVPGGAALQMVLLPPPAESRMAEPVRLTIWIAAAVFVVARFVRRDEPTAVRTARGPSADGQ